MKLQGKVALVVGGGRGIGKAIALAFARDGADVAIAARTRTEIETVSESIRQLGRKSVALEVDVTDECTINAMLDATIVGLGHLDILVNSAGVSIHAPVKEIQTDDWRHTLAVNLTGPFLCCRAALPHMLKQGSGCIITIGSAASKRGIPNLGAYSASKFGLLGFSEALAREVGSKGIRVNMICPGPVATRMRAHNFPQEDPNAIGQPEDLAGLAVFLASDEGKIFSGAALDVLQPED